MTRKQFLATGAAPLVRTAAARPAAARPKNVLLLVSDQHRPHALSCDSNPYARTPHLDALAHSGVRFDDAYCSNPVCTPSRASILTGLYTHNHQAWSNGTPWPFEHKTMAHMFGRAGYMSALIGKMHFVDAQTHGFDYRLDFNDWFQYLGPKTKLYADELSRRNSGSGLPQIDDLWRDFGDPWEGAREKDNREGAVHVGRVSKIPERDHFESFVARESVRFLKEHSARQPFFLVSSFLKPHDPFMPAERWAAMYRPEDMKLPDTWGKADFSRLPKQIVESIRKGGATPELRDPAQAPVRMARYYASIAQLDDAIGQVMAALKETGLERDTIVIYTSDHGEMLGEHGLWHKFVFFEPSAGVPLIVRVPGVTPEDARSKTPVTQVSLSATLAELCGLTPPGKMDAASFVQDLREPARTRDTTVYSEFALRTPRAKYMIRRGDYKYNHYMNDMPELYNLREDPSETKNLAEVDKARVEDLKGQLFAWHRPK